MNNSVKNGIDKIFVGEVLALISTVCIAVANLLFKNDPNDSSQTLDASSGIGAGIALVGALLMFISFIVLLVGFAKAGKFESSYKVALALSLLGIVLSGVVGFIQRAPGFEEQQNSFHYVSSAVSNIINILMVIFVCKGTANLLTKNGDKEASKKGVNTMIIVGISFAVAAVIAVLQGFDFAKNDDTMRNIFIIAGLVVSLVGYIVYIAFLSKAKEVLE